MIALTDREIMVLSAVARGYTNREVGFIMFLKEKTIKSHLRSIFIKLGADTRTGAVWKALELGIITPPRRIDATQAR